MDVRQYRRFSDLVKALRQRHRLSQRAMAKALAVSPGYVGQWELALSQPSAAVAAKLCQAFHIQDVEYVQRLAYAQRAPRWLRESIIQTPGALITSASSMSPGLARILAAVEDLSEPEMTRLADRVEGWVAGVRDVVPRRD